MTESRAKQITITGDLGSGKSLVCALLAECLGARIVSTGSIQRAIASDLGINTLELNKRSETDLSIDQRIDDEVRALASSDETLIFDSRLAWHFLPNSFKVCLTVSLEVAAKRVFGDGKRSGEAYASIEEAMHALHQRRQSELHRFRTLYQVECDDYSNYDLVVDTSDQTPEAVAELILAKVTR